MYWFRSRPTSCVVLENVCFVKALIKLSTECFVDLHAFHNGFVQLMFNEFAPLWFQVVFMNFRTCYKGYAWRLRALFCFCFVVFRVCFLLIFNDFA